MSKELKTLCIVTLVDVIWLGIALGLLKLGTIARPDMTRDDLLPFGLVSIIIITGIHFATLDTCKEVL